MKAVFSSRFKSDLLAAEEKYRDISDRLAGELRERIAGQAREIIRWNGGDHVGPHGFPCRSEFRNRCKTEMVSSGDRENRAARRGRHRSSG